MDTYKWTAAIFALGAVGISWRLISQHLRLNHNPLLRKYVVRVILLVPVYAVDSWLGLAFSDFYFFWDTLRDCYEAMAIFSFYRFLVEYLGGESWIILRLGERRTQQHTAPFCCLKPWSSANKFVLYTKLGALQYVFVKVLIALLELVLVAAQRWESGSFAVDSAYLYLAIIVNFSQIWAIYCLALLYLAASDMLKPIRPLPKFLCIKAVVFFTWWQSVILAGLEELGVVHETARVQDFIICIEMFIAAVALGMAFPVSDFPESEVASQGRRNSVVPVLHSFLNAANVVDVVKEVTVPRDNQVSMNVLAAARSPQKRPSSGRDVESALLSPSDGLDEEEVESIVKPNNNKSWI